MKQVVLSSVISAIMVCSAMQCSAMWWVFCPKSQRPSFLSSSVAIAQAQSHSCHCPSAGSFVL